MLTLLVTLIIIPNARAVPAYPGLHTIRQPDGTKFQMLLRGDEWFRWRETPAGHPIVQNPKNGAWHYALPAAAGATRRSANVVGRDRAPVAPWQPVTTSMARQVRATTPLGVVRPTGTAHIPVILVNFPDRTPRYTASNFNALLFGGGKSMRNLYSQMSRGQFTVSAGPGGVVGWYTAQKPHAYYGSDEGNIQVGGGIDARPGELVREAVAAADAAGFNFAPYDQDGNGFVDVVSVIHQGTGEEASGIADDIHSHRSNLAAMEAGGGGGGIYTSNDGVKLNDYVIQPELHTATTMMTVGVFAHEYGHALGLPDLYDNDASSQGLGAWSLMAGGAWNGISRGGDSPAHMDAWSKIALGWATPINPSSTVLGASFPNIENSDTIYRLWTGGIGGNEYFLVENRQKIGFDEALPGSGLLIYHVDDSRGSNMNEWYPGHTTSGNYKVALVQADGFFQLERNLSGGDAGDPFIAGRTLAATGSPNSGSYSLRPTQVAVRNVSASAATMTADLYVGTAPPAPTITSFTPASGSPGSMITVTGANFTDATAVEFNGAGASFIISSPTQIMATVPGDATTGPISITAPGGTGTSAASFYILPSVAINTPLTKGYASLAQATGTASGTNLSTVHVGLARCDPFRRRVGFWDWRSSTWNSAPDEKIGQAATGTTSWSKDLPPMAHMSPGHYELWAWAEDNLGNVSSPTFQQFRIVDSLEPRPLQDRVTVAEDSSATPIDVLANDTGNGGSPLFISAVAGAQYGTVTITGGGTGLTYRPNADYSGGDHFLYAVSNGSSSEIQAVIVTVTPVDDAPIIGNILDRTIRPGTNTGPQAFNIDDVDEDDTTLSALTLSATSSNTTLVPNANIVFGGSGKDRTVTVTPAAGQIGTTTITVTVSDGTLVTRDTFVVRVSPNYTVSGRVLDSNGNGIAGVTITRTGVTTAVVTDGNGSYTLTEVPTGSHTLTAGKSGYTFRPAARNVTVATSNLNNQSFTGYNSTISGRVAFNNGVGIGNVQVRLNSGQNVLTNGAGYYTFTGVLNGSYTVTPVLSGYSFDPTFRPVTINNANVANINFTGGYAINGRIANSQGIGIQGLRVYRTGASTPALTNSAGYFAFYGVTNGTYTLTPDTTQGYGYTPLTRSVVVNGATVNNQNFIGTSGFSVSGRIMLSNGTGIAGVTVTRTGGATATTNGAGYFTFYGVANGSYTLTPSKIGSTFTPVNKSVTVNGVNLANQNFVGSGS